MNEVEPLRDALSFDASRVNVVLFSQPGCEFCAEERQNYLKPLAAMRNRDLVVSEVELEASKPMRDWSGHLVTQSEFAKSNRARFAPTVMFFDARGRTVADPIVGLSRDFFGMYLEQRIALALRAVPRIDSFR